MAAPKISAALRTEVTRRNLAIWHNAFKAGPNGRCGAAHGVYVQLLGPDMEIAISGQGATADEAIAQALADPRAQSRAGGLIAAMANLEIEMHELAHKVRYAIFAATQDDMDVPF